MTSFWSSSGISCAASGDAWEIRTTINVEMIFNGVMGLSSFFRMARCRG
jgi:hypothetical protein